MEAKINGSVYHKFINNYQKPIVITKRESKNSCKDAISKKNTTDSFHSKLIYVNKKSANIISLNQNEVSSETKSITNNSERTLTPIQNQTKSDKNGIKSLLNDVSKINSLCNGLPVTQKIKRKNHQSLNNESNKQNSKSIENENNLFKREKIKNKEEFLHNTIQRLKKLQNNINNINTNGLLDNSSNKVITNYTSNNEPKRKKNFSLNYENEVNMVSNLNTNLNKDKDKDKINEFEYDYIFNSNKINERKKNFIRENLNNRELSRLIQENYNFNYHRKFNDYTDFNKNNSMIAINNQNIIANNRINNSIDCNCNFTENYKRENQDLIKDEFYKTTKTCDEDDKDELPLKTNSSKNNRNKNMVLNSNIQKKKLKELQQKLDTYQKELRNTQKINIELEKKNEDLQKK